MNYLRSIRGISVLPISTMGVVGNNGRWRRTSQRVGTPDILFCYRSYFGAVEVKAPKGKLSPAQELILEEIRLAGGFACVARNVDDVHEMITTMRSIRLLDDMSRSPDPVEDG